MVNYKGKAVFRDNSAPQSSSAPVAPRRKRKAKKSQQSAPVAPRHGYFWKLSAFLGFLSAVGVIGIGLWVGFFLILDPNSLLWLNRYLPSFAQIPIAIQKNSQSLEAIEHEANEQRLIMGEMVNLGQEVLIPFLETIKNCQENCQEIVELRLYTSANSVTVEPEYRLVDILSFGDLNREFYAQFTDFSEPLQFVQLESLESAPDTGGLWFNLIGKSSADQPLYGHLIYYHPLQKKLNLVLPWLSQAQEKPQWQEITGVLYSELLINQSDDQYPHFTIYTLTFDNEFYQAHNPTEYSGNLIQFSEISLEQPAITLSEFDGIVEQVQDKMWIQALHHLNRLENNLNPALWSQEARQYKDAIAFHAQLTQEQCQAPHPSIIESILTCLRHGEGTEALEQFQALLLQKKTKTVERILEALNQNATELKPRLEKFIQLNPFAGDLKIWQGLILETVEDKMTAQKWLEKAPNTDTETLIQFEQLLTQIERLFAENLTYESHPSRILGTATPLENVNLNQWRNPTSSQPISPLQSPQKWYLIDVNSFHDGEMWNHAPFPQVANSQFSSIFPLWQQLGLDINPRLQIITRQPQGREETTLAQVKGIQVKNNRIQLLAVGIPLDENVPIPYQPRPLAYSESAFKVWESHGKISLLDLYQLQPQFVQRFLRELKPFLPSKIDASNSEKLLTEIGHWQVKTLDLTGNDQPEGVLTLYQDETGNLDHLPIAYTSSEQPSEISQRTLIFSDQGKILYNELSRNSGEFLMNIAELETDTPPVLIIDNGEGKYVIKYWSSTQKEFVLFSE